MAAGYLIATNQSTGEPEASRQVKGTEGVGKRRASNSGKSSVTVHNMRGRETARVLLVCAGVNFPDTQSNVYMKNGSLAMAKIEEHCSAVYARMAAAAAAAGGAAGSSAIFLFLALSLACD